MNEMDYRACEARYYMPAFSREIMIERGFLSKVWDAEGKEYIDCVAGIAVCSTGHCHPEVTRAICEQAGKLIHCSNLYYVPGQAESSKKTGGDHGHAQGISCKLRCGGK